MLKIKTKTINENVLVKIKGDATIEECIVTIIDLIDKTSKSHKELNKKDLLELIIKLSREENWYGDWR